MHEIRILGATDTVSTTLLHTMQQSIQTETGAQLLTRLMSRPSLQGLEQILFEDGPRQNEVIEISGNLSSGKTLLLTQLLTRCLLPKKYKDIKLNGLCAGAILVNTDHHFEITTLVNLMRFSINNAIQTDRLANHSIPPEIIDTIIEDSLSRLTIVSCYESTQFLLALQSLRSILSDNDKIAMISIDSISSYYWQDRESGEAWSMDAYLSYYLKTTQKNIINQKVVLLYTRPSNFISIGKETTACVSAPEEDKVNYRIQLKKWKNTTEFSAEVHSATNRIDLKFSISDDGIKWKLPKAEK